MDLDLYYVFCLCLLYILHSQGLGQVGHARACAMSGNAHLRSQLSVDQEVGM